MKGYPQWFPTVLLGCIAVVTISGYALVPHSLFLNFDFDVTDPFSSATIQTITVTHGVSAYFVAILFGSVWTIHIHHGWNRKRHRVSGLSLALALVALIASGLGLYYFAEQEQRNMAILVHLVIGLLLPLFYLIHWARRRRS